MSARDASVFCNLGDHVDDAAIAVATERLAEIVGFLAVGRFILWAREPTAGLGAPRHDGDPKIPAQRQHLELFLAIEQV